MQPPCLWNKAIGRGLRLQPRSLLCPHLLVIQGAQDRLEASRHTDIHTCAKPSKVSGLNQPGTVTRQHINMGYPISPSSTLCTPSSLRAGLVWRQAAYTVYPCFCSALQSCARMRRKLSARHSLAVSPHLIICHVFSVRYICTAVDTRLQLHGIKCIHATLPHQDTTVESAFL